MLGMKRSKAGSHRALSNAPVDRIRRRMNMQPAHRLVDRDNGFVLMFGRALGPSPFAARRIQRMHGQDRQTESFIAVRHQPESVASAATLLRGRV